MVPDQHVTADEPFEEQPSGVNESSPRRVFLKGNMGSLREKYLVWMSLPSCEDRRCIHATLTKWRPDELVCDKELAWREVVRERDGDPEFPFRERVAVKVPNSIYDADWED